MAKKTSLDPEGKIADLRAQVARLEAANAAKDAALRELGPYLVRQWEQLMNCGQRPAASEVGVLLDQLRAALSDTGESWLVLSTEAQAKLHEALDDVPIASASLLWKWYDVTRRAALVALGGKP